jgi:hypothetical protein
VGAYSVADEEAPMATATRTAPAPIDLRTDRCQFLLEQVLDRTSAALQVQLHRGSWVRKRRSVGATSDRGTWIRVEARPVTKLYGQGNGIEAAAALAGIAKPSWHASVAWDDRECDLMWRVDETDLVSAAPIKSGGTLVADPGLDDTWWKQLNVSLDARAGAETTRVATVHTEPMTQQRVTAAITGVSASTSTRPSRSGPRRTPT